MKIFLSVILLMFTLNQAVSQSFEVVEGKSHFRGGIGEKVVAPIKIRNLTQKPIQIVIKRTDQVIGTSQSTYFCWDDSCYDSEVDQIPLSKRVQANETTLKLESVLEAGLVEGISTVKYIIYNRDNPSDAVEYEVNYTVEDNKNKSVIFNSRQVVINEVYPNPVTEFAIVEYNITEENAAVKIVLHNVLGSVVGEYDLPALETRLKIKTDELNPGVYFYSLHIENDRVFSQKIIVRN